MPIRDVESFAAVAARDARFFANRGANGIDGLVSTASGLSLGAGRRPTWALLGDLATGYDIGGLPVLANLGLPVKLVVADNGGGRIFEFLPQAEQVEPDRFNRLFITPVGARLRGGRQGLRAALRADRGPGRARRAPAPSTAGRS